MKICLTNNIAATNKVGLYDHGGICYTCLHNCSQNAIRKKEQAQRVSKMNT